MSDGSGPWDGFTDALAIVLPRLEVDQFVILEGRGNRFVQFIAQEGEARVETVSNQYLPAGDQLPYDDLEILEHLGWELPTHHREVDDQAAAGSPNHYLDLIEPIDPDAVARLLVDTLRLVHEVFEPTDLRYRACDELGQPLALPELGLDPA